MNLHTVVQRKSIAVFPSNNAFRSTFSSIALETIDGSSLEFMRMVGDDVENVQLT